MSELHRGVARIASNYARLAITLVLGLILVRVLLVTVGEELTGLIDLLGSTIGLAAIIEEIVSWSMIRELGVAHHSGKEEYFRRMFNSALVVSAGGAVATIGVHIAILLVLPLIAIPTSYINAASWFIVAKGLESAFIVILSPLFNMYLVTERQVHYNFWLAAGRSSLLLAAISLFWMDTSSLSSRLIWFAWASCLLHSAIIFLSVCLMVKADRRLIPAIGSARRYEIKNILSTNSWNVAILGSQWLGLPAAQILMNLQFGLFGNLTLGRASQISGYTRMLATGMNHGIEAVSVRLSSKKNSTSQAMKDVLYHSARLHAVVVFPISIGLAFLAEPIFRLWLGSGLDNADLLPSMVLMTRILLIAFMVMSISDNWIKIMYGAGYVRRYAPAIISGGIINVALAILLLRIFPSSIKHMAFACAFSVMYGVCYMGFLPKITALTFDMKLKDILSPLVRPLIIAIAASPLYLLFLNNVKQWNLAWLSTAVVSYGLWYALLCWFIVLSRHERAMISMTIYQWLTLSKS